MRPAHRVGADEDAGDEDRGRNDDERLQPGEHGDHDAGIAEPAGEIGREIALEPGDLGGAGKAGERAGEKRRPGP